MKYLLLLIKNQTVTLLLPLFIVFFSVYTKLELRHYNKSGSLIKILLVVLFVSFPLLIGLYFDWSHTPKQNAVFWARLLLYLSSFIALFILFRDLVLSYFTNAHGSLALIVLIINTASLIVLWVLEYILKRWNLSA